MVRTRVTPRGTQSCEQEGAGAPEDLGPQSHLDFGRWGIKLLWFKLLLLYKYLFQNCNLMGSVVTVNIF